MKRTTLLVMFLTMVFASPPTEQAQGPLSNALNLPQWAMDMGNGWAWKAKLYNYAQEATLAQVCMLPTTGTVESPITAAQSPFVVKVEEYDPNGIAAGREVTVPADGCFNVSVAKSAVITSVGPSDPNSAASWSTHSGPVKVTGLTQKVDVDSEYSFVVDGIAKATVSVGPVTPWKSQFVPAVWDTYGNGETRLASGIAIDNLNPTEVEVKLTLVGGGNNVLNQTPVVFHLPPNGHVAKMLNELFGNSIAGAKNFNGIVRIVSTQPTGAMGLSVNYQPDHSFTTTSTPSRPAEYVKVQDQQAATLQPLCLVASDATPDARCLTTTDWRVKNLLAFVDAETVRSGLGLTSSALTIMPTINLPLSHPHAYYMTEIQTVGTLPTALAEIKAKFSTQFVYAIQQFDQTEFVTGKVGFGAGPDPRPTVNGSWDDFTEAYLCNGDWSSNRHQVAVALVGGDSHEAGHFLFGLLHDDILRQTTPGFENIMIGGMPGSGIIVKSSKDQNPSVVRTLFNCGPGKLNEAYSSDEIATISQLK